MSTDSSKGVSTLQIAWRNLGRNRLRTALVVAAIALSRLDVDSKAARAVAACSLVLWTGVVLAGRWIAYADYLFALP